jgi:hypothetical protein
VFFQTAAHHGLEGAMKTSLITVLAVTVISLSWSRSCQKGLR